MTAHFPSTPVDLLAEAIESVRQSLIEMTPTKRRIQILWAAAKAARDFGASDVVSDTFMALAIEVNLIDKDGRWTGGDVRASVCRFGADDVSHVITWALRGWSPFEKGPLI